MTLNELVIQASAALAAGAVASLKGIGTDAVTNSYTALKRLIFDGDDETRVNDVEKLSEKEIRQYFLQAIKERQSLIDENALKEQLEALKNALKKETSITTETIGVDAIGWIRELVLDEVDVKQSIQPGDHKTTVARIGNADTVHIKKITLG